MEFSLFLGNLHPKLVPFPVVLLLTGLLLDAAGLIWRSERAHWAAKLLMFLGTATLLLAFICGISAEIWAGRAGVPHHQIQWHELAATVSSWGFILLTAWRLFLDGRRGALTAYVICGLGLYALLALTGYLGGELVQEYGASVRGARAETIQSLHDLNTLAQRQTDLNLHYSDIMHRSAGSFVLLLTLAIFVRALWPQHAGKVRWVGPALLMSGGVLLFFFADLDLYRLTDPRQFLDREAQAHKLISLILFGVGLRALTKKPAVEKHTEAQIHFQNRLVAVLALVGGGLLFTHVHTVAPYANVAAGVYINHIVMGFVALGIGGVKLVDDALPGKTKWRTLLFPSLLLVESFLLVTYTEGIPWWAGIGHYNRWGSNGGCIASFGKERAELVLDPDSGEMDVRVFERFADKPVFVSATSVTAIIAQGYRETAVPLSAVDTADGKASHFRGQAEFLKNALQFDARVTLPLDGKWRTGYFDPWVTPVISGIPPNVIAKFVCPMHEGVRSAAEGECRLCGMPLVPLRLTPSQELHDAKFAMDFAYTNGVITLRPRQTTGQTLYKLQMVHEHLLHLIIVSEDLTFFDHVHPVRQFPEGAFTLPYTFPRDGRYILFADIMPEGERAQVFRLPVVVGGSRSSATASLMVSPALSREIGPYHVEMILQPRELVAERHANIAFRLSRDGKPVTDLQPYIGAMGHCVIISENTQGYLHSHPEQFTAAPPPEMRGGPEVSFHTTFPKPGRYKLWGQFKRGDEIIVADFVVNVERPLLPRWLVNVLVFD
jgi:uncharacterized membrane protein